MSDNRSASQSLGGHVGTVQLGPRPSNSSKHSAPQHRKDIGLGPVRVPRNPRGSSGGGPSRSLNRRLGSPPPRPKFTTSATNTNRRVVTAATLAQRSFRDYGARHYIPETWSSIAQGGANTCRAHNHGSKMSEWGQAKQHERELLEVAEQDELRLERLREQRELEKCSRGPNVGGSTRSNSEPPFEEDEEHQQFAGFDVFEGGPSSSAIPSNSSVGSYSGSILRTPPGGAIQTVRTIPVTAEKPTYDPAACPKCKGVWVGCIICKERKLQFEMAHEQQASPPRLPSLCSSMPSFMLAKQHIGPYTAVSSWSDTTAEGCNTASIGSLNKKSHNAQVAPKGTVRRRDEAHHHKTDPQHGYATTGLFNRLPFENYKGEDGVNGYGESGEAEADSATEKVLQFGGRKVFRDDTNAKISSYRKKANTQRFQQGTAYPAEEDYIFAFDGEKVDSARAKESQLGASKLYGGDRNMGTNFYSKKANDQSPQKAAAYLDNKKTMSASASQKVDSAVAKNLELGGRQISGADAKAEMGLDRKGTSSPSLANVLAYSTGEKTVSAATVKSKVIYDQVAFDYINVKPTNTNEVAYPERIDDHTVAAPKDGCTDDNWLTAEETAEIVAGLGEFRDVIREYSTTVFPLMYRLAESIRKLATIYNSDESYAETVYQQQPQQRHNRSRVSTGRGDVVKLADRQKEQLNKFMAGMKRGL